jgi:hypothetical protein
MAVIALQDSRGGGPDLLSSLEPAASPCLTFERLTPCFS